MFCPSPVPGGKDNLTEERIDIVGTAHTGLESAFYLRQNERTWATRFLQEQGCHTRRVRRSRASPLKIRKTVPFVIEAEESRVAVIRRSYVGLLANLGLQQPISGGIKIDSHRPS